MLYTIASQLITTVQLCITFYLYFQ